MEGEANRCWETCQSIGSFVLAQDPLVLWNWDDYFNGIYLIPNPILTVKSIGDEIGDVDEDVGVALDDLAGIPGGVEDLAGVPGAVDGLEDPGL